MIVDCTGPSSLRIRRQFKSTGDEGSKGGKEDGDAEGYEEGFLGLPCRCSSRESLDQRLFSVLTVINSNSNVCCVVEIVTIKIFLDPFATDFVLVMERICQEIFQCGMNKCMNE